MEGNRRAHVSCVAKCISCEIRRCQFVKIKRLLATARTNRKMNQSIIAVLLTTVMVIRETKIVIKMTMMGMISMLMIMIKMAIIEMEVMITRAGRQRV